MDAASRRINLVPCGSVTPELLCFLENGLKKELKAEVTQIEKVPVPSGAYDPRRRQYRAEALMSLMPPFRPGNSGLVLGVTAIDLFVPDLNFVFGLADYQQKCAIISLARLQPEFYGLPSIPRFLADCLPAQRFIGG